MKTTAITATALNKDECTNEWIRKQKTQQITTLKCFPFCCCLSPLSLPSVRSPLRWFYNFGMCTDPRVGNVWPILCNITWIVKLIHNSLLTLTKYSSCLTKKYSSEVTEIKIKTTVSDSDLNTVPILRSQNLPPYLQSCLLLFLKIKVYLHSGCTHFTSRWARLISSMIFNDLKFHIVSAIYTLDFSFFPF